MKKGFTLIEILVVISIIGILVTFGTVSFTSSQKQARDTLRKSDLRQYELSLKEYASKNTGLYPVRTGSTVNASTTLCTDLGLTNCTADPKDGQSKGASGIYRYYYQSDTKGTLFTLRGLLENQDYLWVICSTGEVGTKAVTSTFSGGACPP